jgi:hypothetical protein
MEPELEQTHGMLLSPLGNLSHTSIPYYCISRCIMTFEWWSQTVS